MSATLNAGGINLEVEAYGPDEAEQRRLLDRLASDGPLHDLLGRAHFRWLGLKFDDDRLGPQPSVPDEPNLFTAHGYDYTNERAFHVAGALDDLGAVQVRASAQQPLPSREEWLAAVDHLRNDATYGPLLRSGAVKPYRPMPPYVAVPLPDGRTRRALTVGLSAGHDDPVELPLQGGGTPEEFTHRVVAMTMATGELYRDYLARYPEDTNCGGPLGEDECAPGGYSGAARVTLRDEAGDELWKFLVVRPAASSGTQGSGVELRHVTYRGEPVLRRAHVPLVNVLYLLATSNCGPSYRDWVNQETCIRAVGTDVGAGFRVCSEPPTTIFDTGEDGGNFRGVALWLDEDRNLRLVSEVAAGWYRYASEWTFEPDGTIRPRFGFDAVDNPCTCQTHVHHCYWRLDFGHANGSVVQEFNDPPLDDHDDNVHTIAYEVARLRERSRDRHWRITDAGTGRGHRLIPGASDGEADLYGAGDAWLLRYHEDEIDDGQGFTNDVASSRVYLDTWADGESIDGQDVVAWYGGHFLHDPGTPGSYVGPVLRPLAGEAQPGSREAAAASAEGWSARREAQRTARLHRQIPRV
ncbi:MAG TPA: hypothetical protein VGA69_02550 [Nitriliruptorales bacterium]